MPRPGAWGGGRRGHKRLNFNQAIPPIQHILTHTQSLSHTQDHTITHTHPSLRSFAAFGRRGKWGHGNDANSFRFVIIPSHFPSIARRLCLRGSFFRKTKQPSQAEAGAPALPVEGDAEGGVIEGHEGEAQGAPHEGRLAGARTARGKSTAKKREGADLAEDYFSLIWILWSSLRNPPDPPAVKREGAGPKVDDLDFACL